MLGGLPVSNARDWFESAPKPSSLRGSAQRAGAAPPATVRQVLDRLERPGWRALQAKLRAVLLELRAGRELDLDAERAITSSAQRIAANNCGAMLPSLRFRFRCGVPGCSRCHGSLS